MNKPKIYVMIGLSASGKSTIAKEIAEKENCVIVSSDAIREELYTYEDQEHNAEVFQLFHKRIKENLLACNNVIADATNITMKSRRSLLENIKNVDCEKIAYIVPKDKDKCIEDNIYREHPVPHHVIERQMMNFQIPFYEEGGWDKIEICGYKDIVNKHSFYTNPNFNETFYNDCYTQMEGFEQHNPHHTMTLGEHCDFTRKKFKEQKNTYVSFNYDLAASLHDIGKLFTQSFDDNGVAHYYQHAEVGTYYLLSHWSKLIDGVMLDDGRFLNMLFLINYHMLPMNWNSDDVKAKWKRRFGEEKYQLLLKFNECDKAR